MQTIEGIAQTRGNPKSLSDTCKDIPGEPKKKKRTLIEYFERKRTLNDNFFSLSLIVDPKESFF